MMFIGIIPAIVERTNIKNAEMILGPAIINVLVIGSRDRKYLEDVLAPVAMSIING